MQDDTTLFDAAGVELEPPPKAKRSRKPRPPSPAERAAAGRLEGARRSREQVPRNRVGRPRDLSGPAVLPFPLSRNAAILSEVIARLPHGHADNFNGKVWHEKQKLTKQLIKQGIPRQSARSCAKELLDAAFRIRVIAAHKEAGIL